MGDTNTSPRPWRINRVSSSGFQDIIDADGNDVADAVSNEDAALIVDAVNAYDRVAKNLDEVDHLKGELEEAKAHASSLRWLVHRLVNCILLCTDALKAYGRDYSDSYICKDAIVVCGFDVGALIDEARKAIGEKVANG